MQDNGRVTIIQIPQVDDEPIAAVLRSLAIQPLGADTFRAQSLPQMGRIYGGQVVAQALIAACSTLDEPLERLPHSLHAYFLVGGDPHKPIDIEADRVRDGRSFSSRTAVARQEGRDILTLLANFHIREDGPDYSAPMPDVPEPEKLMSALEYFRTMNNPVGKYLGNTVAFESRHVQDSLYMHKKPKIASSQQVWIKPRVPIPNATPLVGRILLAYVLDQFIMEPALRSRGLSWLSPGLMLASLDHAMWFHRDFDINDWLLLDQNCPSTCSNRAMGSMRVFTREGVLVAEVMQEAMMRVLEPKPGEKSHFEFNVPPAH